MVGVAGVAGNGQSELFAYLSGELIAGRAGAILIDDKPVGDVGITAGARLRAAFVPEERNGHAAAPDFTLSENIVLTGHGAKRHDARRPHRRRARARQIDEVVATFDVRKSGADPLARTLSGGNLQKFVVGREILERARHFRRQPADLGRRRAGVGRDPSGAAGSFAREASRCWSSARTSTNSSRSATASRSSTPGDCPSRPPARDTTREAIGLLMAGMDEGDHAH